MPWCHWRTFGAPQHSSDDTGHPINNVERYRADDIAGTWDCEAALIHGVDDLAQHHGQLELTRDLLRADRNR